MPTCNEPLCLHKPQAQNRNAPQKHGVDSAHLGLGGGVLGVTGRGARICCLDAHQPSGGAGCRGAALAQHRCAMHAAGGEEAPGQSVRDLDQRGYPSLPTPCQGGPTDVSGTPKPSHAAPSQSHLFDICPKGVVLHAREPRCAGKVVPQHPTTEVCIARAEPGDGGWEASILTPRWSSTTLRFNEHGIGICAERVRAQGSGPDPDRAQVDLTAPLIPTRSVKRVGQRCGKPSMLLVEDVYRSPWQQPALR